MWVKDNYISINAYITLSFNYLHIGLCSLQTVKSWSSEGPARSTASLSIHHNILLNFM